MRHFEMHPKNGSVRLKYGKCNTRVARRITLLKVSVLVIKHQHFTKTFALRLFHILLEHYQKNKL